MGGFQTPSSTMCIFFMSFSPKLGSKAAVSHLSISNDKHNRNASDVDN